MPSGIVYVIAEFSVHSARVTATGRPSAETVLGAFLDDFLPQVGLQHLTGQPRFVPCGAVPPPRLSDPWRTWAQAAAATLIIFDARPGGEAALAAPHPAPQPAPATDPFAPVSSLPAERTGIIEYLTGPDSGFAHPLPIGAWTMGRTPAADVGIADPYLSRELLSVSNAPSGLQVSESSGVRSIPLGTAATLTGFGSTAARIIPPQARVPAAAQPGADAAAGPGEPATGRVSWPRVAAVARPRAPSWLMYAAPIVIGILLAVFTKMWMFLLFSVSGPVTAGIMFITGRRRYRRDVLAACRDYRAAVRDCLRRRDAADRRALDRSHRRRLSGGQTVIGLGPALLPGGIDRIPVDSPHAPPASERDPLALLEEQQLRKMLDSGATFGQRHFSRTESAPLVLDLTQQQLQITGPHDQVAAVLRAVLVQLLARGVPVRLAEAQLREVCPELAAVALRSDAPAHVLQTSGKGSIKPGSAGPGSAGPGSAGPGSDERAHVDVLARLANPAQWEVRIGPAGDVVREVEAVLLDLDSEGRAQLQIPAAAPASLPRPLTGEIEPTRMRAERFLTINRAWQPPVADWQQESTLGELLAQFGMSGITADGAGSAAPAACHSAAPDSRSSAVPLGLGPSGPVLIDLFTAGPHALLAGTTGSGKSVLLQTWIASLAARFTSAELRFVLIDFKGGAAFAPFQEMAHTDAVVSNLDPAAGMRTLRNLGAEILRRERLLAEHGAADIETFNASLRADADLRTRARPEGCARAQRLPRLVVIIDEFHALITEHPSGTEVLESLTAVGRSLGIHVVLATQRPAGIVTPRMKANINLRIALRVRDGIDSREVIDCEDAAAIPPEQPGFGYLSDGGPPAPFRTATIDVGETDELAKPHDAPLPQRCEVQWTLFPARAGEIRARSGSIRISCYPPPAPPALTIAAIVAGSQQTARALPPPHRVIPPPLPEQAAEDGDAARLGILDFPDDGMSEPWRYDPDRDGSVIITGGSGSGTTSAVLRCAQAAAASGRKVVLLSASAAHTSGPAGGTGFLTFCHDEPWTLEYLLALFDLGALSPAEVCLCIDDYDALAARHEGSRRLDRLAQLLTAGGSSAPLFVIAAGRRFLHSPVASRAPTRIVFPTADTQDSLHFGLPAGRFAGRWPPGRAVVLGPVARSRPAPSNATEGVAVQLVRPAPEAVAGDGGASALGPLLGSGARVGSGSILGFQREEEAMSFRLGRGPLGEEVAWVPEIDGAVLSVRGPDELCRTVLTTLAAPPEAGRGPEITALIDAHTADPAAAAQAAAADVCALSFPLTAQLPYSSPLQALTTTGPRLLLGLRQQAELSALGVRDLPLPPAGWAWFISGTLALPVDVSDARASHRCRQSFSGPDAAEDERSSAPPSESAAPPSESAAQDSEIVS